ncbi:MAG: SDR family NAD(P)-dependent oxidoreductase [Armatimonadota bacterium]|nr:SDR family NAD(P)-dependent oxidoreductase [Armatimonadota bacterium]
MTLAGKVAIVTGAGRGIGRAIALALAREGADLVLGSRTLAETVAVAEEARAVGRRAAPLSVDVANYHDVQRLIATAVGEFGRVDILVNNAAVQGPIGPLWQNPPDEWARTIQINLVGVFYCCHEVIPVMRRQGGGKIINLSGGGATAPRPYFSAYAASKAAVVRLTETLAEELKEDNIQVNAIAPGAVATRMTDEILAAGDAAGPRAVSQAMATKRDGSTPDNAAALAVFLASEASGRLTGKLISAVWDDWRSFPARLEQIMTTDLYTLRRVIEARPSQG